LCAWEE